MFKKYTFLSFVIGVFLPFPNVYGEWSKVQYLPIKIAKLESKDLLKSYNNNFEDVNNLNNLNEFSEFSDLDDKDILLNEIYDPFEKLNRSFFYFSLWLDKNILASIEIVYFYIFPPPIKTGFINFVNNVNEPINIVNHLLQFKIVSCVKSILRFFINTSLGCFGFFDAASTLNILYNPNDLGYTLTYYHVGEGFYIFFPILGPYTFKNGLANIATNVIYSEGLHVGANMDYLSLTTLDLLSRTVSYLDNRKSYLTFMSSSPDIYSLVKSAYIQNRNFNFHKLKSTW